MQAKSILLIAAILACAYSESATGAKSLEERFSELEQLLRAQQKAIDSNERNLGKLGGDSSKLKAEVSKLQEEETLSRRLAASPGVELTHIWLILCGALVMFMQAG